MIMTICLAAAAQAGVAYMDPSTGWEYIHQGDGTSAGDGTWDHNNGSDAWDGSAIGADDPGGVSFLTDGAITFIRIQDCGDPRDFGLPDDSNRKIMFTHDTRLDVDDNAVANNALDNGVTLSFRARISTTAPLDDTYWNDDNPNNNPWPAAGDGHYIHSGGKGMFQYFQSANNEHIVGFSLCLAADRDGDIASDGLAMNSFNGDSRSDDVDSGEGTAQNILSGFDPTEWHEFWITIVAGGSGTHVVTIYMDGSFTPAGTFDVTSGKGNDESYSYIGVGSGNTNTSAAFDTDFFAWAAGAMPPPDPNFNPPPVVDAGPDQTIYMGETAQLAGTATDAGPVNPASEGWPGGVASLYWYQASGPGTATFTPADGIDDLAPTVTFTDKGAYTLMLQVSDGYKDANDTVTIYVLDHADEFIVGHWEMEDDLTDSTASANHGEPMPLSGTPEIAYVAGAVGTSALHLDNPDNGDPNGYVHLGPAPELDFQPDLLGVSSFTASAWVKTTNTNTQLIIQKGGDGGGGIRWMLRTSGGNASILTDDDDNKETADGQNVADGLWHHVLGTCNNDGIKIYVDGVFGGEDVRNFQPYSLAGTSQRPGYIGAGTDASGTEPNDVNNKIFDGFIDDVRVYNYALTDAEILALTAMGPIVATVEAGADFSFNWKPTSPPTPLAGVITDNGRPDVGGSIMWSTTAGPDDGLGGYYEAAFAPGDNPVTTATFTEPGVYTLTLTVYDPDGLDLPTEGYISDSLVVTVIAPTCADVILDGLLLDYDFDEDCYIGLSDFVVILTDYLKCNDPLDPTCPWPF